MTVIHTDRLTGTGALIEDDRVCANCGDVEEAHDGEFIPCQNFVCEVCAMTTKIVYRRFAVEVDRG